MYMRFTYIMYMLRCVYTWTGWKTWLCFRVCSVYVALDSNKVVNVSSFYRSFFSSLLYVELPPWSLNNSRAMRSCHSHECSEIGTWQRTRFRVDKTNGVVNLERDTSYTIIHKVCVIEAMTTILCTTPGESLERLILRLLIKSITFPI